MAPMCRWRSRPQHQLRTHAPQQNAARASAGAGTSRPIALVVLVVASESQVNAANNSRIWEPLEARRVYRAVYSSTLAATLQREHQARLDRLFQFDAEASPPLRAPQGNRYLHYQPRLLARLIEARSLMLRPNP